MTNVAGKVWSHVPFVKRWRKRDAESHAWSGERESPAKHGARIGAVHGPPYGAVHRPRYAMGSPLGRYGRSARGARAGAGWPQKSAKPVGRKSFQLRGLERRAAARLRMRRQALAKRTRSGFHVGTQDMRRALAKGVLALFALLRATSRVARMLSLAHIVHLSRHQPHHVPLGRRGRQTNLRAGFSERSEQLAFLWEEEDKARARKRAEASAPEAEIDTSSGGVTAYKRGYASPDAQFAANELHFDQSNARAIHGAISSASRHAQGKRDHRGM